MKQMPRIKMMGIGHGGNHMLDYVMNQSIRNVEYITVADEETLLQSGAERSIQLDAEVMKCFYMDGHLNVKKIKPWITMELDKVLIGAEVLFIMAGMGGQVGSDIAPIVAQRKSLGLSPWLWSRDHFLLKERRGVKRRTMVLKNFNGMLMRSLSFPMMYWYLLWIRKWN